MSRTGAYYQQKYEWPPGQWINQTGGTMVTNTTGAWNPVPVTTPPPEPKPETKREKAKRIFANIGLNLPDPADAVERALPPMAGAAPEAEVSRRTEHKKKIVLERKVGVTRDKGGSQQQIHTGTVELVRTIEGDANQTRNIGIKVAPSNGSSFVEIPASDILEAIKELAEEDVRDTSSPGGLTDI